MAGVRHHPQAAGACRDARRNAPGPARRGERGAVLLLVTVAGLLAMAIWMLAWRSTHDAIRVDRFVVLRDHRAHSVMDTAARGIALLRTGLPPAETWACLATASEDGSTWQCAVTFTHTGGTSEWVVDSRLATQEEIDNLPAMPGTFAP